MKKLLKSKIFWAIVAIVVIIAAFAMRSAQQGKQVEYVTEDVKMGNIAQTVSATGQIKSASEIELNFENSGQLAVLNVKVGDEVEAGRVLAQLRATNLAIDVNKARADLDEAIANLDKLKAGATTEDVAVYKATVEKARTDLANAEATYSQAISNEKENILISINTALTKANISLQKVYDTLNYKGDNNNFATSNLTLRQKVNDGYNQSVAKADEAELAYNIALLDSTEENINTASGLTLSALSEVSATLDNLSKLFDYVIFTTNLTQSELDTLKTIINTERTTIDSSINTVQGAVQDLADARLNYQTKVEEAKKDLGKALADLKFKEALPRSEDITLYEARVKKAQAALQSAQDKYNETIIQAPIAGVITDINFDIGEQTNLSQPVIAMLAVENYEIEVDIPESDIVKIDIGDETDITLDAFTSDDIFKGIVTTINPAQTEIQDVIYYRVTVTFEESQPAAVASLMDKIKPGMTANVIINTDMVSDVLIIPLRAIQEKDGQKTVDILENGQPKTVEVQTGLRGDEGFVEIKSGLSVGQKVITFVRGK